MHTHRFWRPGQSKPELRHDTLWVPTDAVPRGEFKEFDRRSVELADALEQIELTGATIQHSIVHNTTMLRAPEGHVFRVFGEFEYWIESDTPGANFPPVDSVELQERELDNYYERNRHYPGVMHSETDKRPVPDGPEYFDAVWLDPGILPKKPTEYDIDSATRSQGWQKHFPDSENRTSDEAPAPRNVRLYSDDVILQYDSAPYGIPIPVDTDDPEGETTQYEAFLPDMHLSTYVFRAKTTNGRYRIEVVPVEQDQDIFQVEQNISGKLWSPSWTVEDDELDAHTVIEAIMGAAHAINDSSIASDYNSLFIAEGTTSIADTLEESALMDKQDRARADYDSQEAIDLRVEEVLRKNGESLSVILGDVSLRELREIANELADPKWLETASEVEIGYAVDGYEANARALHGDQLPPSLVR